MAMASKKRDRAAGAPPKEWEKRLGADKEIVWPFSTGL